MTALLRPWTAAALAACLLGIGGCEPSHAPTAEHLAATSTPPKSAAKLPAVAEVTKPTADFGSYAPSSAARYVADRVVATGDAAGLPFLIVDKAAARVLAFDPTGHLIDEAPALLGLARGDDSVPGIGDRRIANIRPEERTTPAGRFAAELGENAHGEDILWVDYDNAVSMHRMRSVSASERRAERLASPTPDDNRVSYGCINLPPSFYDRVVKPLFQPRDGIVYVLPETRPVQTLFATRPVASAR